MSKLAEYLKAHSMTQAQFALKVGLTQGYIARLCRHGAVPKLETASRIERATDGEVPVSAWLLAPSEARSDGNAA